MANNKVTYKNKMSENTAILLTYISSFIFNDKKRINFIIISAFIVFSSVPSAAELVSGFGSENLSIPSAVQDTFQNGDIIFQKSISNQSPAVAEAQGAPWSHVGVLVKMKGEWYVAESRKSSLDLRLLSEFITTGTNEDFVVKRVRPQYLDMSSSKNQNQLQQAFSKYKGKSYDVFFEWSDERIYCSEFATKVYKDAFGINLGTMQKVGDLNLDGPLVKQLIKDRLESIGKKLNKNEPILTPWSLMLDETHLFTVFSKIKSAAE